jgi:hypothetical protein
MLTEEQQNLIVAEWNNRPDNPPSLLELIRLVYPDKPDLDGRCKEGKYIQAFLAKRSLKARGAHEYQAKKGPVLTDENKQFILNNAKTMKPLEITRIIFDNPTLSNLNHETRIVAKFISDNIAPENTYKEEIEIAQEDYVSPRSLDKAINKVNRYIYDINLKRETLNSRQKKDLECLLKYINTYRFGHQINSYESEVDRDLFESSFIRYTHDKNDLTEEEVDQYIILSSEVVIASNIQRRVEKLQRILEDATDNDARVSMALVESINTAQSEYNQCVNRQQKLVNDLKTKRSDRLGNQIKQNASIINLIQTWKEEESRQKMIRLAELKKKTLEEETEKMEEMDELKCRILGISKEEILNG